MELSYRLEIKQGRSDVTLEVLWFDGFAPTAEQGENALDENLEKLNESDRVSAELTIHYCKSKGGRQCGAYKQSCDK